MRESAPRQEKPRRRTRAELRQLMLAAGQEVLLGMDPSLGFEQLSYRAVFEHLQAEYGQRVTIGSVHERIWKAQRDFQLDVVAEVLADAHERVVGRSTGAAMQLLAAADLTTPAQRRYATQTAVRLGGEAIWNDQDLPRHVVIAHAVRFRLWELGQDHSEARGFIDTIRKTRLASKNAYVAIIRQAMDIVDLRVRADAGDPDDAIDALAIAGNSAVLGLRTDVLAAAHELRRLPTGPQGEPEPWRPAAIALWAMWRHTLELGGDDLDEAERAL